MAEILLDIASTELKSSQISPRRSNLYAVFILRDALYEETNPEVKMNLPLCRRFVIHSTVSTTAFFLIPIKNIAKKIVILALVCFLHLSF